MMQYVGMPYLVRLDICQRIEFAMLDRACDAHCVDCSTTLVVKSAVGLRAAMMVNDIWQNDITAPVSSDKRYRETSPTTSKLETRCLVQLQVMKHHCSCCATPFTWRQNRRWSTSEAAFANTVAVLAMTLASSGKISLF